MTIWTISAPLGTHGDEIGADLAERAGVPLLDRQALAAQAHELNATIGDADELEERVCGRLASVALGFAVTAGSSEAARELDFLRTLPELGQKVLAEATRTPAVVLAHGAFAALKDHPGAVHVRLRAPFDWRVEQVRRAELVSRDRAEHLVRHDDHLHHTFVRRLFHADENDPEAFSLVADVSRLSTEQVVDLLLALRRSR